MSTETEKKSSAIFPLIIVTVIAAAGWISFFMTTHDAAEYQAKAAKEQMQHKADIKNLREKVASLEIDTIHKASIHQSIKSALEDTTVALEQKNAALKEKDVAIAAKDATLKKRDAKIAAQLAAAEARDSAIKERDAALQKLDTAIQERDTAIQERNVATEKRDTITKERDVARRKIDTALSKVEIITKEKEAKAAASRQLTGQLSEATAMQQRLHQKVAKATEEIDRVRKEEAANNLQLRGQYEKELKAYEVQVSQLHDQITVINVAGEILFASGSAEIKPKGRKVLDIIAHTLSTYPDRNISIEGHTDSFPIIMHDPYPTNWELSAARAASAVRYLEHSAEVDPARMRAVGHGSYSPVAPNNTRKGRARNRRIEIIILPATMPSGAMTPDKNVIDPT